MMLSNDKNIEALVLLIENTKEYIELQKEYLKFDVTEKIIQLATMLVLAIILFSITIAILLYISLSFIHWISPIIGTAESYAVVAGCHLVLLLIIYGLRKSLIERALTKFIVNILLCK